MKLILKTTSETVYIHNLKGGSIIIIQDFVGNEKIYTYAEALRLGIVQYDHGGRTVNRYDEEDYVSRSF